MAVSMSHHPLALDPQGPLAQALDRRRDFYNQRFAGARRKNRRLDSVEFQRHVVHRLDPIIRALDTETPEQMDEALGVLFDVSLHLLSGDMIGSMSRQPLINEIWERILPRTAHFLRENPERLIISLSNAAYHLSNQTGVRGREWLEIMERLSTRSANLDEYLAAGQVAAWRSGMSHLRAGALKTLERLPVEAVQAVFSLTETSTPPIETLVHSLTHDAWLPPEFVDTNYRRRLAIAVRIGDFTGFGGPFAIPPQVTSTGGTIYAFDSHACWSLHADCFGATLQRFCPDPSAQIESSMTMFTLDHEGVVTCGPLKAKFPAFAEAACHAANDSMLAVTLPRSHRIFIVAPVVVNGTPSS
jgi:hypothetical protein